MYTKKQSKNFKRDICFRAEGKDECGDEMNGDKNREKNIKNNGDKNTNDYGNSVIKCGREMDNVLMSEINETEGRVLQLFQTLPNDDHQSPCPSPTPSIITLNTISTEDDVDSKTDSSTDVPITSQSVSLDLNLPMNLVNKRLSVYDMTKNIESTPNMSIEPSAYDISNESMTSEICYKAITEVQC